MGKTVGVGNYRSSRSFRNIAKENCKKGKSKCRCMTSLIGFGSDSTIETFKYEGEAEP